MMTDETPAFARVLKQYRVASGLTHEQLAERARLSARGISDLERGVRTQPRAYTVRQLGDALGLSDDDRALFEAAAHAAGGPSPDEDLPLTGPFLGALPEGDLTARDEERECIRSALDTVQEGTGQVLLLVGEPGIGKTRLLQELMVEARARRYVVLGACCVAVEQRTALAPFVTAIGELATKPPPGLRTEFQRGWKRVQRLAPSMEGDGHGVGAVAQQEHFNAVTDLLMLAAGSAPVVLLLDDLQWADGDSLTLLAHLARTTWRFPILLAGAFRDAQLTGGHPALAQTIQTLARERLAERLSVRRLSLDETTRLIGTLMGEQEVSEEFAYFAYRRTKGIPRLIEQLIRSLGGRLELEGEIGAGSMGRVFRAYDRERSEDVAAKLLLAQHEIDLNTLLRFQQEGAVLARLHHPHIVRIHDTFVEEHASCIIMELLEGESLGQILQAGPLPLDRAKAITLQVAGALSYAHSQEIVHRDIKPDNVMVLDGDQVKVTDFGIARLLQPVTSLQTIATTGMQRGTPQYMAPEQIEGTQIDGRTDIYALGAMLYHMVTGRPPFEDSDALAVAVKHLQREPVAPSSIDPTIPGAWDAVILKAMAKEPARRFQTAEDLKTAIAGLTEEPATAVRVLPRRRRIAILTGLMSLLLGLSCALWLYASTPSHASTPRARIDAYLTTLASHQQLSGTVLVARRSTIILEKGYGLADRAHEIPNTANTKYAVSGVSDSLSVLGVMQLIQRGDVEWWTPICIYVPRCPATWKAITVRMVLDGTANLPDLVWGWPGATIQRSMAWCEKVPLGFSQGMLLTPKGQVDWKRRSRSAIAYWRSVWRSCATLVLSSIIDQTAGPWDVYLDKFIFAPAGMTTSGRLTDGVAAAPFGIARGYVKYSNGIAVDPHTTYNDFFEAYSTAHDVYAYDSALFAGRLLSRTYLARLLVPHAVTGLSVPGITRQSLGYLWNEGVAFGHRIIWTDSSFSHQDSFANVNMRFPDAGITVIVLSNDAQVGVEDVAMHVAALMLR